MGLFLICPHCQTRLPLAQQICLNCGANLRDLPGQDRRYFIGAAGAPSAEAPAPTQEAIPELSLKTVEPEVLETYEEIIEPEVVEHCPKAMLPETPNLEGNDVSLCEALDRILNKGAVLFGEVMISVADIDLVYLGLQVILSSMETARGLNPVPGAGLSGQNLFDKGVY
jgi:gas vesicle structural protein